MKITIENPTQDKLSKQQIVLMRAMLDQIQQTVGQLERLADRLDSWHSDTTNSLVVSKML